ncbi:MAG: hydrogenase expression/formation protein HypE [Clostridiales bacterium]|nr:hydrogenase expression/formation protein HypE [Clostridiales bacterium]
MKDEKILAAHGGGGALTRQLVEEIFLPAFANDMLLEMGDSALFELGGQRLALTTDSFVVRPLFFPGGDIGRLAVCGTVNDLAVSGAKPLYLSVGMIIEEGFAIDDLRKITASMSASAAEAGVKIITGDTKVVGRGQADGLYINTSGVGLLPPERKAAERPPAPGDFILLNGNIAEHGLAVMAAREGLTLNQAVLSDVAPLNGLIGALCENCRVLAMRDPTRGGVAASLNEWAQKYHVGIEIEERQLPISKEARALSEILGLDPLVIANEGKFLSLMPESDAPAALELMKKHLLGKNSAVIGKISAQYPGKVSLRTLCGGLRLVEMPSGEILPRIC